MRSYPELKQILELWEQGMSKQKISQKLGIPRITIRDCIKRYGTIENLDALMQGRPMQVENDNPQRTYIIPGYTSGKRRYSDEDLAKLAEE